MKALPILHRDIKQFPSRLPQKEFEELKTAFVPSTKGESSINRGMYQADGSNTM